MLFHHMDVQLTLQTVLLPAFTPKYCPACPLFRSCSVGMLFLPNNDALEAQAKAIIDEVVSAEGLKVLGYRQVPVDHAVVGRFAKDTQPRIWQVRTGN